MARKTITSIGLTAPSLMLLAIGFALAGAPTVLAATFTWDIVSGDGATITSGSGTWDNVNTNWNNGTTNVAWPGTTHLALLGGPDSSYTITMGAPVTATNLQVANSGYTIAGTSANPLTLDFTGSTGTAIVATPAASQIFVTANKTFNIGTGSDTAVVKAN